MAGRLFLVIQTGTIAAVGVAFGKFLGIFCSIDFFVEYWILHFWKVPPIRIGPMVLGRMDVGLNTQNLAAILVVVALSVINIFGVKTGALIQNVFTAAKVSALLGLVLFGVFLGRNARRWLRTSGKLLAQCRSRRSARRQVEWAASPGSHADHSGGRAGRFAVFRRCLE